MPKTKGSTRKFSPAAGKYVEKEMRAYKHGKAHSGPGGAHKVQSRQQAVAIGLSEARKKGLKVPEKK